MGTSHSRTDRIVFTVLYASTQPQPHERNYMKKPTLSSFLTDVSHYITPVMVLLITFCNILGIIEHNEDSSFSEEGTNFFFACVLSVWVLYLVREIRQLKSKLSDVIDAEIKRQEAIEGEVKKCGSRSYDSYTSKPSHDSHASEPADGEQDRTIVV